MQLKKLMTALSKCLILSSLISSSFAAVNGTEEVQIADAFKLKIQNETCSKYVGTGIDWLYAEATAGKALPSRVYVHCKPHNTLKNHQLRAMFVCNTHNQLSCGEPNLEVIANFPDRKVVVAASFSEIYDAVDAVSDLNTDGKFKDDTHFKSDKAAENACSVYGFKNNKWTVACEKWGFDLRKVCVESKCNFEFVSESQAIDN